MNLHALLLDKAPKTVILDTDTYNEVDDQYALAYAMRSADRIDLKAITVAPFKNSRAATPAEGMEKSFAEAHNIRALVDPTSTVPIYRGSDRYLPDAKTPVESDAANAIIRLVRESTDTVYIVAIGAITNVASALLLAPDIAEKAVIVWLGGHALHWKDNHEFNLFQDVAAAKVVFDSKAPLVQIPCNGVCTEFLTTMPELRHYIAGKNPLCDYLLDLTERYMHRPGKEVISKVIWDVTAVAALAYPETLDIVEIPRPIITDSELYAIDQARPTYLYVRRIRRDPLFLDLFEKLTK